MRLSRPRIEPVPMEEYLARRAEGEPGGRPLEANGVIPDAEVRSTRETLLAGRDAVLDAALDWIRAQKSKP